MNLLAIVGNALNWAGLVIAAVAIVTDWRGRRLGPFPGVRPLRRWWTRQFARSPLPKNSTIDDKVGVTDSLSVSIRRTPPASAPWQEHVDARLFNLEQWRNVIDAQNIETVEMVAAERRDREALAEDVVALAHRVTDAEGEDRELTRSAKSWELVGVLCALLGAALTGLSGLLS